MNRALGTAGERAYTGVMGDMTFPPQLQQWIDARVAEGRYADAQDYLSDLIRRDQDAAQDETEWLREQIRIGEESGISEQDPFEFLDELRTGKHDRQG